MEIKDVRVLTVEEKRLYDYGRKAGIKEVVEWIEAHTRPMNTNRYGISLGRDEWQAKLKELK